MNSAMFRKTIPAIAFTAMLGTVANAFADTNYLNSQKDLKGSFPFSEAVKVDKTLYLSGQIGLNPGTMDLVPGGIGAETKQMMENIKTSLEAPAAILWTTSSNVRRFWRI